MEIRDIVYEYRISTGDRMAWHSRYHAHGEGEYELHYFLEGAGSFLNHRAKYPIRAETLFLTGPHEFHAIIPDTQRVHKQPISYYALLFKVDPEEELHVLLNGFLSRSRGPLTLNVQYHFIFETIHQLGGAPHLYQQKAAVHQLMSFLYRMYGHDRETHSPIPGGFHHVQKALEVMRRGVRKKMTVEYIAHTIGISKEYLIRLFNQHLRITPLQYATRLRIEAASGDLISTEKPIGEIALQFGFENQFHFSRVFKKCTGQAPSIYRKYYLQYVDLLPPRKEG